MAGPGTYAIEAEGLRKRFGETEALAGIDLAVPEGSVCALLGPNGAGKTTAVRILATLTQADEGWARVAGFDVAREPTQVRRRLGLAAQDATVDGLLTATENLEMIGELHHLAPPSSAGPGSGVSRAKAVGRLRSPAPEPAQLSVSAPLPDSPDRHVESPRSRASRALYGWRGDKFSGRVDATLACRGRPGDRASGWQSNAADGRLGQTCWR